MIARCVEGSLINAVTYLPQQNIIHYIAKSPARMGTLVARINGAYFIRSNTSGITKAIAAGQQIAGYAGLLVPTKIFFLTGL